jgi:6-phosphogluconolactonase
MRAVAILLSLLVTGSAPAADVVYVSVAGEKRIAVFEFDSSNGRMHRVDSTSTSGEPGALTTDPRCRYLFAALRSTGELAAFRIDPANGKLTLINTAPGGADPAYITTDKRGKFLLTAYYVAGEVTVHTIGADGSLVREPRQRLRTTDKAHAVVLDPWEMGALVPHTGPNLIYAIPFIDGRFVTESYPPLLRIEAPKGTGPRHLVFQPTLMIHGGFDADAWVAYVSNEQGSSVTMYQAILNPINWSLKPMQTISTLPKDFKGENSCAEIRLHPSNRFLYVSNRGHDSLACFEIDKHTGRLTALGQTPTEKTPRSFDLDPSGKFLFAAGEASGRVAGYSVDETSGKLSRIATYEVGRMPWWVMVKRLPGDRK